MNKKTWKHHLLSSGLPLEQSVIQVLSEIARTDDRSSRYTWRSDYTYPRENEYGVLVDFSVDIQFTRMGNPWLEFLIECKYRYDGHRWVFTPEEYHLWRDETFSDTFVILEDLADNSVDFDRLSQYKDRYPLCGKGIELQPESEGSNPKSINQSIQQLKFALVEQSVECLMEQIDRSLGDHNSVFILVPIVVTTADLWRFRSDVTLEDVRQADKLDDIADQLNAIIVRQLPDSQLTRHTSARFENRLSAAQKAKYTSDQYRSYRFFLQVFSRNYPRCFLVVQYKHFDSTLRDLLSIFDAPDLLKPRSNK
jgi:hypothetical protein